MAVNEEDVAWLGRATEVVPMRCRSTLEGSGGDREAALQACVREFFVPVESLDPDLVGEAVYGLAMLKGYLRNCDSPSWRGAFPVDAAEVESFRRQYRGEEPLATRWLEAGAARRLDALLKKHPEMRDPRARYVQVEPFPELKECDGDWEGFDTFPAWAGFQSRGGGYASRDHEGASTGRVGVRVLCGPTLGGDPTPGQVAGYRCLKEDHLAIREVLMEAARAEYARVHRYLSEEPPGTLKDWPNPSALDDLALRNLFGIGTVHVFDVERDGIAYVGLECGCVWDEEHGFGVLLHGTRLIAAGQGDVACDGGAAMDDSGKM